MAKANRERETSEPVVIKKYANRRLYNTATSSYVTLDDLCAMVKAGTDFVVHDAKSGDDITRSVLTQIIFEQEAKGQTLLPINFLRQLIGFYDDRLNAVLPSYLEVTMENFARNQEQMRRHLESGFGDIFPVRRMEEIGRRNMAMFREALSLLAPFGGGESRGGEAAEEERASADNSGEIRELRRQLDRMQKQLDELTGRGK
jgi:polyhydroxyalkanoate synthesis repressor PhaR